jgi:glyoxylase-like metal-dependent hydrolase (beta-lactamase superfamily II)
MQKYQKLVTLLPDPYQMKIKSIEFSSFKVEGQKMFDTTPKKLWSKLYPPDENGLCQWALRSLLIDDGQNVTLIDTGFSNIDSQILKEYFIVNYKSAEEILKGSDFRCDQINFILHTHLHLDHCGGSFILNNGKELKPSFPNAAYIISRQQLDSGKNPGSFEKDSFQPKIIEAFTKYQGLKLVDTNCCFFPWLELRLFEGHTKGLLVPVIHTARYVIVFIGDLIPSSTHLFLESIMSYNIDWAKSINEQKEFLKESYENNYILFFQHDFFNECCTLKSDNGNIVPDRIFRLSDLTLEQNSV